MKLRPIIFVVVSLMLTVTVCAAQSPMGFSPTTFYELFDEMNSVTNGPECVYMKGDEEQGAFILSSESLGINMMYSGNKVTDLYLYYYYLSADEESSEAALDMFISTLITLWTFYQYESLEDISTIDGSNMASEVMGIYLLLQYNKEPLDYWGYHFEMNTQEENGYTEGLLRVTKAG